MRSDKFGLSILGRRPWVRVAELAPALVCVMVIVIFALRSRVANGTELGSYSIYLPVGYSVQLTSAKPAQAQLSKEQKRRYMGERVLRCDPATSWQ